MTPFPVITADAWRRTLLRARARANPARAQIRTAARQHQRARLLALLSARAATSGVY